MSSHATVSRCTAAPLYRLPPRFPNRGTGTHLGPNPRDRSAPQVLTARAVSPTRLPVLQAHRPLAEVAELLGDSKRVAADDYLYALTNFREVDRSIAAIAGSAGNRVPANPCIDAQGIWGPISNNGK